MRAVLGLCIAIATLAACGTKPASVPLRERDPLQVDEMARFATQVEAFYWAHLDFRPDRGVSLGHHQYDGKLPDRSPEAIEAEIARLNLARANFGAAPSDQLDDVGRLERDILLVEIQKQLFDLEVLRSPAENPLFYVGALSLAPYVTRDYAPIEDRARAIIALSDAAGAYVGQTMSNLAQALPRTWLDNALLQTRGMISFAKTDVVKELSGIADEAVAGSLTESLGRYRAALGQLETFLAERLDSASDSFALGEAMFLRMLRDQEGIDVTLAQLEEIGLFDLARNLDALEAAARAIEPNRDVKKVVAGVNTDRPTVDTMLEEASEQATAMRQLLIDEDLVTIPSDDIAEVRISPPFMRWNSAFLSSAGPFEKRALPGLYYISPPDPAWSRKEQREYIPSRGDLLFTTVHELWPGHFLHSLHRKKHASKVVKSFCSYSMSEGWAHYAEELMWEHGAGDGDPRYHIGQLGDALLRNARFLSAIGLHAKGISVAEAREIFETEALADARTARQQALRGTFDPGYLNYTLGKLMIKKLRDDWRKKKAGEFSLKAFHDEFLSYGCAAIPVIRERMLGHQGGPAI